MTLTKYEQSGFILITDKGFKLAIDIGNKTPTQRLGGTTVDAMIVSHIHGDHFSLPEIVQLEPKKLYLNKECQETLGEEMLPFEILQSKAGEKIFIDDIIIEPFIVDHGPNVSAPVLENFGFLITSDGQTIYFAGDMFYPSGLGVAELEVDFALLPVGGFYTFGPAEALAFAKQFKKIGTIIPMHEVPKPENVAEFVEMAKKEGFSV